MAIKKENLQAVFQNKHQVSFSGYYPERSYGEG
jgi:hypothetical protein